MTAAPPSVRASALPLIDHEVLRSFVAIAENASFSRAARQLFRTPSALSMQIKSLEGMLAHQLFLREARRVSLTPEGEILLGYARRLLKLNQEAVACFLEPALDGSVRLGTPDDVGTRILPQVLSQFARSHPAVQVDVVTDSSVHIAAQLDAGDMDIALVTVGSRSIDARRGEIVHTEPLVWAGRRNGIAHTRTPLPLALADRGCPWRATALKALDDAGIRYRVAYSSEHCAGQDAAMRADLAIAPFPKALVAPPLQVLEAAAGLPTLGDYHIALLRREHEDAVIETLARHIVAAFQSLRR